MKLSIKLFLLLILWCAPLPVLAELPDVVLDDFAVVEGVVVMPIGEEYIVDLDARENLHVGDILTVVKSGKNIFHPVTNEVIGTINTPVGFLQVTRIHSGYSYAKVLTEGLVPADGAALMRFEQVPAVVVADAEANQELVTQIQTNLPQFEWLESSDRKEALLTFSLSGDGLDVRTAAEMSLHKYTITEDQEIVSTETSAPRPYLTHKTGAGPKPKILQQFANTFVQAIGGKTNEERFAEMDEAIIRKKQIEQKGIWMGPAIDGHPNGLTVGDLDGDGQQEVAVALEEKILIGRILDGQFNKLADVPVSGALQILSIDAIDLDGNGRAELYLSALAGTRPSSFVVEFDGSNYGIAIKSVRWLLRVINLPGDGGRTLVGQRLGAVGDVFSGEIFGIHRQNDELVKGAPLSLPEQLNLFNFISFFDDKGQLVYLYLTNGDYLKAISADGVELWESTDYFGGSENCFTPKSELRDEHDPLTCMRPRMVMMPGKEILVAQNDGQRMVQGFRRFGRSRVMSMAWNGFALMENWQTASQPGYLGDFVLADADNDGSEELVMAVKFQHAGLTDKARSSIVIYELN